MKKIALTIIISIISIILSGNVLYSTFVERTYQQAKMRESLTSWEVNYELTILFIKEHEGFNKGYSYNCPAGHRTIGYGHIVKKGEVFPYRISQEEAEELLRKDFNAAIQLCEKYTDLTGTKKLAIAHFIYAKGIGNFLRSGLKRSIENDKPIEKEILKWCVFYKPDGTKVRSKYSYKIRQWELEMYNK